MLLGRDITKCPKCNGKLYLYKEVYDNKGPPRVDGCCVNMRN